MESWKMLGRWPVSRVMTTWLIRYCLCFSPWEKNIHVDWLVPKPHMCPCCHEHPLKTFGLFQVGVDLALIANVDLGGAIVSNQEILSSSKAVPKTSSLPLNFCVLLQLLIHPLIFVYKLVENPPRSSFSVPSRFSFSFYLRPYF